MRAVSFNGDRGLLFGIGVDDVENTVYGNWVSSQCLRGSEKLLLSRPDARASFLESSSRRPSSAWPSRVSGALNGFLERWSQLVTCRPASDDSQRITQRFASSSTVFLSPDAWYRTKRTVLPCPDISGRSGWPSRNIFQGLLQVDE